MTTTNRRPRSCGPFRNITQQHYPRLAWGSSYPSKMNKTVETSVPEEKSVNVANKKEVMKSVSFDTQHSELSPRIASGNHLITGKCEGVSSHGYGLEDPQHFYLTTNKQDFGGNHGMPAPLRRPKCSRFFPAQENSFSSSYEQDYGGKMGKPVLPIRSASGNRNNKPHPLESFIVWKFPSRLPPMKPPMDDLDVDTLQRVSKELLRSTYQMDYMGIPQGTKTNSNSNSLYPSTKDSNARYSLDSTNRFDYQLPQYHGNLKAGSSRYGCNANNHVPAVGAVPNVSQKLLSMQNHPNSLYSQEYKNKSDNVKEFIRPNVSKSLNRRLDNRNDESESTLNIVHGRTDSKQAQEEARDV